jgi:methylmalonyl-CoA mutase C-terminal domain/subunit
LNIPISSFEFVSYFDIRHSDLVRVVQERPMTETSAVPLRIVLAKVGLDGHDRGIKVVARGLRDAGFHVIYSGLWQTPEAVARTVADEDADYLGLSILSGAHMTLVPRILEELKSRGLEHVGVLVGGIIPEEDVPKLLEMGVAQVFGPGTPLPEIAAFLRRQGSRTQ